MGVPRRGESWKQNDFTLYPNSADVAEAEPQLISPNNDNIKVSFVQD
jgi:hypothetical protein